LPGIGGRKPNAFGGTITARPDPAPRQKQPVGECLRCGKPRFSNIRPWCSETCQGSWVASHSFQEIRQLDPNFAAWLESQTIISLRITPERWQPATLGQLGLHTLSSKRPANQPLELEAVRWILVHHTRRRIGDDDPLLHRPLTRKQLAQELGVSVNAIGHWYKKWEKQQVQQSCAPDRV
jgi:hypothetical protein